MRLWIVAAVGLTADLWTKDWAFRTLSSMDTRVLIKDLLSFQLSLNPGALFGLGWGWAPLFVGASVLALIFVLYLFANSSASRWSLHLALGMVLAGALGNLYDRTMHQAYVAYYPGQGRHIGQLIRTSDTMIWLGDYPTGKHVQAFQKPTNPKSGMQPVVRDFIKIEAKIGRLELWPWIFNIADALLVVGVSILLLNFWFDRRQHDEPTVVSGEAAILE